MMFIDQNEAEQLFLLYTDDQSKEIMGIGYILLASFTLFVHMKVVVRPETYCNGNRQA